MRRERDDQVPTKPRQERRENCQLQETNFQKAGKRRERKCPHQKRNRGHQEQAKINSDSWTGRGCCPFTGPRTKNHSGELSGDLQGLPEVEHLDSENLHELIEEGNAFEANVLTGVQDAEDNEGKEVHTHEVPEDDVPGEYLDQD